jgi:hypothetical protein
LIRFINFQKQRIGKGEWIIEIIPEIKDTIMKNNSLKYGCVVTVKSTQRKDVYTQISSFYPKIVPEVTDNKLKRDEKPLLSASQVI